MIGGQCAPRDGTIDRGQRTIIHQRGGLTVDKKTFIRLTKLRALQGCAFICAGASSLFTWVGKRFEDAEVHCLYLSSKHFGD